MSAKTLEICPEDQCARKKWGRGKVKRAITAGAGLIFKGSGFYITDYRSENYKEGSKKESAAGETKPAADKGGTGGSPASETKSPTPAAAPSAPVAAKAAPSAPGGKEK